MSLLDATGADRDDAPVAIEATDLLITRHAADGPIAHTYSWQLFDEAGVEVACSPSPAPAIQMVQRLAGIFEFDATVTHYSQRIVNGTLRHADNPFGTRYTFRFRDAELHALAERVRGIPE